jgi:thymidine kinase
MEPFVVDRTGAPGWIEVICGSMFSGKTEELIRRLRRARIAQQRVQAFKPAIDARYSDDETVSHDETALSTTPVHTAAQILLLADSADVIGIDEAQFFDDELVSVCRELAAVGTRVIIAGLDQDYRGEPFEPIPQLMAIAEYVSKLHAICMVCGAPANHSQRLVADSDRVLVGAQEAYEPRCRRCFEPNQTPAPTRRIDASPPLAQSASDGNAPASVEASPAPAA